MSLVLKNLNRRPEDIFRPELDASEKVLIEMYDGYEFRAAVDAEMGFFD